MALFWLHVRGEVRRGFTLFTGVCFLICGLLAVWLRVSFPPTTVVLLSRSSSLWFDVERTLSIAFLVLLAISMITLLRPRWSTPQTRLIGPLVPLIALGWLWSAALVDPSPQLFGLGAPLAVLAGGLALGSALTGLSLGHWYLVSPSLSVRPLIRLNFLCMGAIIAQSLLLVALVLTAPAEQLDLLLGEYSLFFGVRVIFGLLVPLIATVMVWRTARIRSLDSATGLLYIVAALVLAGEIAARTLYFLTGIAT